MAETSDIIVIGGGMAGVSAAARLAPHARIIVLERETAIGYHSTGRSAAVFIRNYGNATLRALNDASAAFLDNPEGLADSSLLTRRGELLIAGDDELDAFAAYKAGAEGLQDLSPGEAVDLFPILRPDRIVRAAFEPGAQDIDVDRMLTGFARRLKTLGGRIVLSAEATAIGRADGKWRVTTPVGDFAAPMLVNAAGAWADVMCRIAGVAPLGLQPMRRTAALLPAPAGHDVTRWPLCATASEKWYAKPDAGKLFFSPADETPVEPHDAWSDDMALAEGLDRFQQATTCEVTRVDRNWAGLRSFFPDRTPAAGFAADGFFVLAGQGGYGIQTAPALSRLAADLILGLPPELDPAVIAALSPLRPALRRTV
ncbi:MAG: FAD-binding oxidoreductase [Phyllobacteriaceae bacterium]|nr:FAD-binding oxidoreductase [Phyllobacteriaceae bacterium]